MKSILRKQTVPRGILMAGVLFVTLSIGVSYASRAQADSLQPVSGQRLITLHDRGEDKSFLTRATSVRKALQDAHIYIDPNDLVEPGLDDELVGSSYEINIYRARPVTIVDGSTRLRVLSAYQTAKQIVEHTGMTLHDEDRTVMTQDADIVGGNTGVQLTIDRATAFTFNLYGKTVTAYTQAKTVAELLKEKGITLGPNDGVSLSQTTPITAGMTIQIWRNGKQTITEEQAIDFPIQQIKDAAQPIGYKQIQTPGVPGKKLVTYEVNMQNGQEVSRTEIQTVVTAQPSGQVEVIGAKAPTGNVSAQKQEIMAAVGISTSDYGYVDYIISHESGWNASSIGIGGACGLPQAYPCSKLGPNWDDPTVSLSWANGYAASKYGGWSGAYNHWASSHNW